MARKHDTKDREDRREDEPFRVEDRRRFLNRSDDDADEDGATEAEPEPARPSIVDEYRRRAEEAEARLHEYIEAYKRETAEHEAVRDRLARDVERKVDLQFGELVSDLLETVDDLELALAHAGDGPVADGVRMARDRFLAALERRGVAPLAPDGREFDPNEAEAIRVDAVEEAGRDGTVTETLRTGYRLGERVIRPARVAVGRLVPRT